MSAQPILVSCPACGAGHLVDAALAGTDIPCPTDDCPELLAVPRPTRGRSGGGVRPAGPAAGRTRGRALGQNAAVVALFWVSLFTLLVAAACSAYVAAGRASYTIEVVRDGRNGFESVSAHRHTNMVWLFASGVFGAGTLLGWGTLQQARPHLRSDSGAWVRLVAVGFLYGLAVILPAALASALPGYAGKDKMDGYVDDYATRGMLALIYRPDLQTGPLAVQLAVFTALVAALVAYLLRVTDRFRRAPAA